MDDREQLDRLTESIIGSAIEVHRALGPGLLESAYERCLSFDLDQLLPIHGAQLLSYLRLSRLQVGLLINFNVSVLKNGVRRIVNSYPDSSHPLRPSAASALKGNAS